MTAVTDQIDSLTAQMLPAITSKQQSFLASAGQYFQGLPSSSVVPADGALAVIDQWDTAPGYQATTWRQAWGGAPPAGITSCMRIDQYAGPAGAGWVLVLQVIQGGVLWERSINQGPETWRDQPWHSVVIGP